MSKNCFVSRLSVLAGKAALVLAAAVSMLLFLLEWVYWAALINEDETVSLNRTPILRTAVGLLLLAGAGAILWRYRGKFRKISENGFFLFCSVLWIAAGIWMLRHVSRSYIQWDPAWVYSAAVSFGQGDYSALLSGGYLSAYPHQLGFIAWLQCVAFFAGSRMSTLLCLQINLFLIWLANLMIFLIVRMEFRSRAVTLACTAASFLFLPQLFSFLFLYSNVPGITFTLVSLYFMLRSRRCTRAPGSGLFLLLHLFFIVLAVLIRKNALIAAIAMAILHLLHFLRAPQGGKRLISLTAALLLLPLCLGAGTAVRRHYERVSGIQVGDGIPSAAFVTMGLQEGRRAAGWYNGYNWDVFMQENCDSDAAAARARADLSERLTAFRDPGYALRFFLQKLCTTWCEPTFECFMKGPLSDAGAYCDTPILQALYNTQSALFRGLPGFLQPAQMLVYLLCGLYPFLLRKRKEGLPDVCLFAAIYLLGGFLFHLLWETKSLYVQCYFLPLLFIAGHAAVLLCRIWQAAACRDA